LLPSLWKCNTNEFAEMYNGPAPFKPGKLFVEPPRPPLYFSSPKYARCDSSRKNVMKS
jgi:hypothetical protein